MAKSLNLDKDFNPTHFEEIDFESFQFNGGEMSIKIKGSIEADKVIITNRIKNSDDLMLILLAKDALNLVGVDDVELFMPYIPYARQDRKCARGESFSLKVFCNILNQANFEKVHVLDPHSDVAPALINNCEIGNNLGNVLTVAQDIGNKDKNKPLIVSPDAGATKKVNTIFENTFFFKDIVKCDKSRDLETGHLSNFNVYADDLEGRSCLIVDDICDGGRTFIGLAKALKEKGTGNLYLFVTHGIFSNGFDELKKHFKEIYCTDSFKTICNCANVTQIKIKL